MTVSFFSYKGGVGRTMMVANTGWALAFSGLRVLLIDCDLEAPGLLQYFTQDITRKKGLIDLMEFLAEKKRLPKSDFNKFRDSWASVASADGSLHPDLVDYIIEIPLLSPNLKAPVGQLHLITTALQSGSLEYAERLQDFSAREFDAQFDAQNLFRFLKSRLEGHYDIILVDSRTGYSEIGRLVADALADAFVFILATNTVNLNGTREAIRYFRGEDSQRPVWVVTSRVPPDLFSVMTQKQDEASTGLSPEKRQWLEGFKELTTELGVESCSMVIPHSNAEGGVESLATRNFIERSLTKRANSSGEDSFSGHFRSHEIYFRFALYVSEINPALSSTRLADLRARLAGCLSEEQPNVSAIGSSNEAPEASLKIGEASDVQSGDSSRSLVIYTISGLLRPFESQLWGTPRIVCLDSENLDVGINARIQIFVLPGAEMLQSLDRQVYGRVLTALADILQFAERASIPRPMRYLLGVGDLSGAELILLGLADCLQSSSYEMQSKFNCIRFVQDEAILAEMLAVVDADLASPVLREVMGGSIQAATEFRLLLPPATASPESYGDMIKVLNDQLDYPHTTGSALKWWDAFIAENVHRAALVVMLQRELVRRSATITEFFLAYVYSNTDNIQGNLHYLDYTRLKKEEEKEKQRRAEEAKEKVIENEEESREASPS